MLIIIYHLTSLVRLNITSPVFYCLVYSLQIHHCCTCSLVQNHNVYIYLFINIYLINNRMLQILQRYHAGSQVDGPPQVTVASSFLIIDLYFISTFSLVILSVGEGSG